MGKYIKLFENHAQYEAFTATTEFIKPNVSHCIQEVEIHYNPLPHDYSQDYLTFEALEDGTFQFTNAINYSTDGGTTWTELAANTATLTIKSGNKIMWKAELTPDDTPGIGTFSSTGNFNVEGNAMSLLFGDNFVGQTNLPDKNYTLSRLFRDCSNLISAKSLSLPATTLANSCYNNMFRNCTSLTEAPQLPATTLVGYCYNEMFRDCTSLIIAPELLATTLSIQCYQGMFRNCITLTSAPELHATTLATQCYQAMFFGCTSLTTAPELPATILKPNCYAGMFNNCTSLTTAPELPATSLANSCYNNIFENCTNLNYIKAMFTTTPTTSYTKNWVNGVASSGTFIKNSAATWNVTGVNGVPTGWTVETA